MSDQSIHKVSLWRQGVDLFWQQRQAWAKLALPFLFLYIPIQFWTLKQLGPFYEAFFAIVKSNAPDMATQIQSLQKPNQLAVFSILPVYAVVSYLFYGVYLRARPVVSAPRLTLGGFFYALGKALLKYMAVIIYAAGVAVVCGVVLGIVAVVLGGKNGVIFVAPLLAVISAVAEFYFFLRYSLVYPLAVEHIPASLKTSAQLVKGKVWRLAGNYTVTYLMIAPVMLLNIGVLYGGLLGLPDYWTNIPLMLVLATVMSLLSVIMTGLLAAFSCNTCRVLYEEKKQADPSFQLTVKAN